VIALHKIEPGVLTTAYQVDGFRKGFPELLRFAGLALARTDLKLCTDFCPQQRVRVHSFGEELLDLGLGIEILALDGPQGCGQSQQEHDSAGDVSHDHGWQKVMQMTLLSKGCRNLTFFNKNDQDSKGRDASRIARWRITL
jgi:hypothetical protein